LEGDLDMVINRSKFREINYRPILPGILYRSSHPVCNGKQVEEIILSLNCARVKTIINLSDDIQSLESKIDFCPFYKKLFGNNNVIALGININFKIMDFCFCKKLKRGILFMCEHNPPYLIHCEAGIDRTGFLALIIEALMGVKIDGIIKDYMLSFFDDNEYSLNYKNKSIYVMNVFSEIKGGLIDRNEDLKALSIKYLREKVCLNGDEINSLVDKLNPPDPV
jgi:protein tyrosine/serine phosphatase